jgi:hypothetical protein
LQWIGNTGIIGHIRLPKINGGLNLEIKGGQVSAEIWGKINIKMPNLNHRFLSAVGRAFLTICAVVALSGTDANAADVPGSACVLIPSGCSGYTASEKSLEGSWVVTGCDNDGDGNPSYSGVFRCSGTEGFYNKIGNPRAGGGRYCWCKLTNTTKFGAVSGSWALLFDGGIGDLCWEQCASGCSRGAKESTILKQTLFTGIATAPAPVQPTNPTICVDHTSNGPGAEGSWEVTGCTGSDVTSFTGFSRCSSTPGAGGTSGNPVADGGQYCWCKITSVKPNGAAAGSWLSKSGLGTADNCAQNCADSCGVYARQNNGLLRTELFSTLKTKGYACVSAPSGCRGSIYDPYYSQGGSEDGSWGVTGCDNDGDGYPSFIGLSRCSSTSGTRGTPGDPVADDGEECWCKLTDTTKLGVVSGRWVYHSNWNGGCSGNCPQACGGSAWSLPAFLSALFSTIGS